MIDPPGVPSSVDADSEPDLETTDEFFPVLQLETDIEDVERQQPGRRPLTEQLPQMVSLLTFFLCNNGFKAQVNNSNWYI